LIFVSIVAMLGGSAIFPIFLHQIEKKIRKRDVHQMYGPILSSVTIGAVKYTKYTLGRKLNCIRICHMYRPMWAKSRSRRL
jgi:hypothetical protein